MCGLVGFIAKAEARALADKRKFMTQALATGVLRGMDSTGVFAVEKDYEDSARYVKLASHALDFLDCKEWEEFAKDMANFHFVIGHNRAATLGSINNRNAHPFQEGAITLVHNGTLRGQGGLAESIPKRIEVDSHEIAYSLNKVGPNEAIPKVVSKLNGAFMLIWYDGRDRSLNLIRNHDRSFHMGWSTYLGGYYFASEADHLYWLNARMNLGITSGNVWSLDPGHHLKFPVGETKPRVKKVELAARTYYSGYGRKKHTAAASTPKTQNSSGSGGGSSTRSVNFNDVYIGGRLQEVPAPLQTALKEMKLDVDDRLMGDAFEFEKLNGHRYAIRGWLRDLGEEFLVLDASAYEVGLLKQSPSCVVRPLGLRYEWDERLGREEPVVVSKIVHASGVPPESLLRRKHSDLATKPAELCGEQFPLLTKNKVIIGGPGEHKFRMPDGTELTYLEWTKQTDEGCALCGRQIAAHEAVNMWWTSEFEPICGDCESNYRDLMKDEENVA